MLRVFKMLLIILLLALATPLAADEADDWVASTLRGMSLEEKVGQTLSVRVDGRFVNLQDERFLKVKEQIESLHLGGVIVFLGTPHDTASQLNALQRIAKVPLLAGGDLERGPAMRIAMSTAVPHNMAIAATGDPDNAAFAGELTAREGRAMGFHWTYSPVADVNNNPANPIINIRSFGEDPQLVSKMVAAYIRAAEQNGILTTAKHFPGHGDTAVDSHMALGVVEGDRVRLDSIELAPFRAAIQAGVSSIMTAHLAVPGLEPNRKLPATLSRRILTDLLRDDLGFKGIIITDALEMAGVTSLYWPGEAAVRAFEAGADVLLLPPYPEMAFRHVLDAVKTGRISERRLDASVERILRAKTRVGLHKQRFVELEKISEIVGDPKYVARAETIAGRSITLVRDQGRGLPVPMTRRRNVLAVAISADLGSAGETFLGEVRRRVEGASTFRLGPEMTDVQAQEVLKRAGSAHHIVTGLFVRVADGKGTVAMPDAQVQLVKSLAALGKPMAAISFGSPYVITAFPEVQTYLCAYSPSELAERAGARALFGEIPITGRLPVTLPAVAPLGAGLDRARLDFRLGDATAGQEVRFRNVFELIEKSIAERAFPGAVLAVGDAGDLVALRSFGGFDYSADSTRVDPDTIYDLASVSKVIGTTTAAAILYEQKKLLLDIPVVRYVPEFGASPDHEQITVRQLLTHTSGLLGYEKLFLEPDVRDRFAILERIYNMPLKHRTGEKFEYSDFGMILMGELIERVAGIPLNEFLRRHVFVPLDMSETFYTPAKAFLPRIPPTEQDDILRHRLMRGEVHDEHAWLMGGVSGHAGMFSTAGNIAAFAQMLLNGGFYGGRRILRRSTVDEFTARQPGPEGSTRAIGWDTPYPPPPPPKTSSSGTLFSPASFGHTGFTGTSIWIDPEKELFVVLLTNRVHPTRENPLILQVRPAVHDAIVEALR